MNDTPRSERFWNRLLVLGGIGLVCLAAAVYPTVRKARNAARRSQDL